MNKITIIGNCTRNAELKSTSTGIQVCSFTVAVNSKGKDAEVTYFRCTAWRQLADICGKYLTKGSKVCVVGAVSVSTYKKDGENRFSLEVNVDDVEFLSSKTETAEKQEVIKADTQKGFVKVDDEESLPF